MMRDNGSLMRHDELRRTSIYNKIFSSIDITDELMNLNQSFDHSEVTFPSSNIKHEKKDEET